MRPITGIIVGSYGELPFDPVKATHPVNVWFRREGTVWFGVAELSGCIPTLRKSLTYGPHNHWTAMCELVGDCWRWEESGDPYGFELTDTDFGDYFQRVAQRAAVKDFKKELIKAFTPLVNLWAFILNKLGAKK